MLIIGIDPGASGGIAFTSNEDGPWRRFCHKVGDSRTDFLATLRNETAGIEDTKAYVEWIHPAIQGIGKSEMSKLYGSYRECAMGVVACGISLEEVKPQVWQRALKCPARPKNTASAKWKNMLKGFAQELFPSMQITLWNCDAILISEYGRRLRCGEIK